MNFERWQREVARARRRRALRKERRNATRKSLTPIPDSFIEAYERYVVWQHQDTKEPIRGLSRNQRHFLETCACFRVDENGLRIFGSDVCLKSRKIFFTSLVIGCGVIAMCKWPGFRVGVVLQKLTGDVGAEIYESTWKMIENLPAGWCEIGKRKSGESIRFTNGSGLAIMTAGSSKSVAEKIGRSGGFNLLIMSEFGSYAHPDVAWAAAKGAVPEQTGWIIGEGTAPEQAGHLFPREYHATKEGHGSFLRAFFFPWWSDENRRYSRTSERYQAVMTPETEDELGLNELAQEERLGLDDEQKAWRRWNYFRGDELTRRQNRREYPEDDTSCFISDDEHTTHLNPKALDLVDLMTRPPVLEEALTPVWVARLWRRRADHVLITTDGATLKGKDHSVVMAMDPWSRDVLGIVHGDCNAAWQMAGIDWILDHLGCTSRARHTIAPERNYDEHVGLIENHLVPASHRLNLWVARYWDPAAKKFKSATQVGYALTRHNRPLVIRALERWVDGHPRPDKPSQFGPQADIPSLELALELRKLAMVDGKVQATPGWHDDLAMAYGGGLYVADRLTIPRPTVEPERPVVQPAVAVGGIRNRGRIFPS